MGEVDFGWPSQNFSSAMKQFMYAVNCASFSSVALASLRALKKLVRVTLLLALPPATLALLSWPPQSDIWV